MREPRFYFFGHGQHVGTPSCCLRRIECIISRSDGFSTSIIEPTLFALVIAAGKLALVHSQQAAPGFSSAKSHLGFSHWSSHLGRGQVDGVAQLQLHWVSSQRGAQFASGAIQVVLHSAGAQTVSHFGQSSFSHMSFGQRTLHSGCSQWTVHWAQAVSWHCISHLGRAQTGWHWAGQTGSSHCHLHSGWHLVSVAKTEVIVTTRINKTALILLILVNDILLQHY